MFNLIPPKVAAVLPLAFFFTPALFAFSYPVIFASAWGEFFMADGVRRAQESMG